MNHNTMQNQFDWEVFRSLLAIFAASSFASWTVTLREGKRISRARKAGAILFSGMLSALAAMWLWEEMDSIFKLSVASIGIGVAVTVFWDLFMEWGRKKLEKRLGIKSDDK